MFTSNRKAIRIGATWKKMLLLTCAATAVGVAAPQLASAAPPAPTIKEISCTFGGEKPGGGKLAGESVVHWDHIPQDQGILVSAGWVAHTPEGVEIFINRLEDLVPAQPAGSIRLSTPEPNEFFTSFTFSVQFAPFDGDIVLAQTVDCR
jgi:hypothetical protein